jgi:peroxiredoxin Q/BCP
MFKIKYMLLGLVLLVVFAGCKKTFARHKTILIVGQIAPDFSLLDDTGVIRKLSDYLGQKIVLYFYPKDFTPGCTQEACGLRDIFAIYHELNIVILGVSYDSVKSHQQFKAKHHLPFALLSDQDRSVANLYGAYQSVKNYFYPERMTFLINEQGEIVRIFKQVEIVGHAEEILKSFK